MKFLTYEPNSKVYTGKFTQLIECNMLTTEYDLGEEI